MNDRIRRALMLLALLVVLASLWFLPLAQLLNSAAAWSEAHSTASAIMYLVLFPICVVFLVPASWIAMSVLGIIPAMSLFVFLGTQARSAEEILSGELGRGRVGLLVLAISSIAVLMIAILLQRAASRALRESLDE